MIHTIDKPSNNIGIEEMTKALEEAIREGSEELNSLRAFLFRGLDTEFFNTLHTSHPYSHPTYEKILQDIIRGINNILKPTELQPMGESKNNQYT